MFRLFPLVLILQVFCLYHAFKNNSEQRWFWLIILLPFIGSLIYLYYHFFNRNTIENLGENITKVVNSNYEIERLEKEVTFSPTVKNKLLLADQHIKNGNYDRAIELLESSNKGTYANDPEILMQLVKVNYLNKNYSATVSYGALLENDYDFKKSEERIAYAWALFNTNDHAKAESVFQDMNHPFSNYKHRLEYANFLIQESRHTEAKNLLELLIHEIDHMDRAERKMKRAIYGSIKQLYNTL